MTLVDANILMYAGGGTHPHRQPCLNFLADVARGKRAAAIDSETLQELLHRYRSVNRWEVGAAIYDQARRIFPDVLPITSDVTDAAKDLMSAHPALLARDAVHAAVVQVYRLASVCSYDRDFDRIPRLKRIQP